MIRNHAIPAGAALGREFVRVVAKTEPRDVLGARRSRIVYPRCGRSRLRRGTRFVGTFPAVTATIAALFGCAAATSKQPDAGQAATAATTIRAKRLRISVIGSAPIEVRMPCYVERDGGVTRFARQPCSGCLMLRLSRSRAKGSVSWPFSDEAPTAAADGAAFPKSRGGAEVNP